MNINIKKLITYLTLEIRNDYSNTVIGYLNSISTEEGDWSYVITKLIRLDLTIIDLLKQNLDDNNNLSLKGYGNIFNNCYKFIDEEFKLSFINEPPFNNFRVNNIQDFNVYMLARKKYLKDYK